VYPRRLVDLPPSTAARRGPGERPRLLCGKTGARGPTTHPRLPDGDQWTENAPTAARRAQGDWPLPYGIAHPHQGTNHATTAATRKPIDRPRRYGNHTGTRVLATPHGGHMGPRGPATPPRRTHGKQEIGHAPTAARFGPGD